MAKVLKHCKVCGLYKLHYQGRRVCCDCYIVKQRTIQPPLNELGVLPEPAKKPSKYQGAEYHRQYRLRNPDRVKRHKDKWRDKVMSLRPALEVAEKPILTGNAALLHIVANGGKCEGLSCKTCPLNYRETCMNKEILAEAKRLLNEEVIRD